jgi:hypothetical protein
VPVTLVPGATLPYTDVAVPNTIAAALTAMIAIVLGREIMIFLNPLWSGCRLIGCPIRI